MSEEVSVRGMEGGVGMAVSRDRRRREGVSE